MTSGMPLTRGNRRQTASAGLDQDAAHPLVERGESKEIHQAQELRHILAEAREDHAIRDAERSRQFAKRLRERAIADEKQPGLRETLQHGRHRAQEILVTLDRHEPGHAADYRGILRNPEVCAGGPVRAGLLEA